MKMRSIVIVFLFMSVVSYSQDVEINSTTNKAYRLSISNIANKEQAMYIARLTEKNLQSDLTWVDETNGVGYFFIKKGKKISDIEKEINRISYLKVVDSKEIVLDDDLFLDIYKKKAGSKEECSLNEPPSFINLGKGNENKAEIYHKQALEIWGKKYPEYSKALNIGVGVSDEKKTVKKEDGSPEHYPAFIDTGNPEYDNSVFEKAKQEWIKNYPQEVEQMTGRRYHEMYPENEIKK